ncbi:MAG: hypothetical protein M1538_00090 [Candidatus Marsarchaeota archaeon]|jgi:antitoxin component HigA of HigAB toxin-antitoxin module|nr:hypothetical protein [Candidatus Marsarchaeota archaeon]
MAFTYEELWQIVQNEKQSNNLQPLNKNIYNEIKNFLNKFKTEEKTEENEILIKNTLKLLDDLYEKRKQKIIIYLAYKKSLPQPPIEIEQEFYNKLNKITSENKIINILSNNKNLTLKTIKDITIEIRLPSGKVFGPVSKDTVINNETDEEDVRYLITSSICQLL